MFSFCADSFDLATNEGVGGVAQHEQLATALLQRHFRTLHVEQRMLAVSPHAAKDASRPARALRAQQRLLA